MKYTTILCLLALLLSLAFAGCSRDPQPDPPAAQLLPPAEDTLPSSDTQPEEPKEDEKQDQPQTENSSQSKENESANAAKPEAEKPADPSAQSQPQATEQTPAPTALLPNFSKELQTRPSAELKDNPQKLDTRLYAVFKNVLEQNFSRKTGVLEVYRLNYDGTEGTYELEFDLTNAYDENGNLNKKAAIEAQMKLAETLQAGINYGQGNREIYKSYDEYTQTLQWLQTPLLAEGFALKNFSSLSLTQEGGSRQIEAVFTPSALKQLFEQTIDGTVTAVLVLADDGSVELLRWEQVEVIDNYPTTIACGEYSFLE